MKTKRSIPGLLLLFLWASAHAQGPARAQQAADVLTALPFTYAVAARLLDGTGVEVGNVPPRGRRMSALESYLTGRADELDDTFANATAVVSIGKLWNQDPLYAAARGANIRIVDIDATKPWSSTLEGIAVAIEPQSTVPWSTDSGQPAESPSPYFWLGPSNAARSAQIVAGDLERLFPDRAGRIEQNLTEFRREVLDLKRTYEIELAARPDVTVFSLANEFVYLTSELGLFVDGYFLKQDIDWTDDDVAALEGRLADRSIPVVIHKWEPDERIANAISRAGAKLVVLDPLDTGRVVDGRADPRSYLQILRENLDAIASGLSAGTDQ